MKRLLIVFSLLLVSEFAFAASCPSGMIALDEKKGIYACTESTGFLYGENRIFPKYVKVIRLLKYKDSPFVISFESEVKNGKLNGPAERIFPSLEIAKMNFKNDLLHGKYIDYYAPRESDVYPGEHIHIERQYVNGKINGKEIEYYTNGQVKSISFYKNDLIEGLKTIYCLNGKKGGIAKYHKGELVGFVQCSNGKKGNESIDCCE